MEEKVVGILGGMGPDATVDLMQRIIRLTPARDDGDHIRCIIDNNPKIPSRIKALLEGGKQDPAPVMAEMARQLEAHGADFLTIACNTAHYYYPAVRDSVSIPVLNIVELVAAHLKTHHPQCKRVGFMASPAVYKTKLYSRVFQDAGLFEVWPGKAQQEDMLGVIKSVKAGDTGGAVQETYARICSHLKELGADIALVGCTDLGVLEPPTTLPIVDAAEVLAQAIVARAKQGADGGDMSP
ncbi:MAG: amino acid racemase [Desulfobacterales bacterium]|nr:amino acid racemase [Desulfobacterales bacterium]